MKKHAHPTERAARFYALLLNMYPKDHRRAFAAQMLQTFKDQHRDVSERRGKTGVAFWVAVIGDEATNIAKENLVALHGRHLVPNLLMIGAILLVASTFVWTSGFIVYIKIPALLLLLIAFVARQSPRGAAVSQQSGEHVWTREGLRFGSMLGFLWVALNLGQYLSTHDSSLRASAKALDVGILLLGMPILFGLAGFISGRRSGTLKDGTLAGLLAAALGAAIMGLSLVVIMILFWNTVRGNAFQSAEMIRAWHASGDQSFDRYLWSDNLGGALAMTIVSLVFGGLLGTLGGALATSLPLKGSVGRTMVESGDGIE